MDEQEIKCALENYTEFGGVYARDEIPDRITGPQGIIVNTDERESAGTHWVAIYVDGRGNGELFDSLASSNVHETFKDWMETNTKEYLFPMIPLQSSTSKLCGVYCIAFLAMRFENWSFQSIINCFAQNPVRNDLFLFSLLKGIRAEDAVCEYHSTKDNGDGKTDV